MPVREVMMGNDKVEKTTRWREGRFSVSAAALAKA
jgi:hypothetical protein